MLKLSNNKNGLLTFEDTELKKKSNIEDELDQIEPDIENDILLYDSGPLGSKTSVTAAGEDLGEFDGYEEAEAAIKEWMANSNWHPSIWYMDDHGGITPYKLEASNKSIRKKAEEELPDGPTKNAHLNKQSDNGIVSLFLYASRKSFWLLHHYTMEIQDGSQPDKIYGYWEWYGQ